MQCTSSVLMIRPASFGFNEQTALTNAFQEFGSNETILETNRLALNEFDQLSGLLLEEGVRVVVAEDNEFPIKPDAIFPNNWFSTHPSGKVVLYPMATLNRRSERRPDILHMLREEEGFEVSLIIDLSLNEELGRYLEGTGSIVFDHIHKIAYASISERTHPYLFKEFCQQVGYKGFPFISVDRNNLPIYHTNVMMCIGKSFTVVCLESITNKKRRAAMEAKLEKTGKEIIDLSIDQVYSFSGNMIQLLNQKGEHLIAMSETAHSALNSKQRKQLSKHGKLIYSPIPTIEKTGGGSVRCMIAEIFLHSSS